MPLIVQDGLPAIDILAKEGITVESGKTTSYSGKLLHIAIVNLMPIKIQTETDFLRILSNTPLHIAIDFIQMKSHKSKNTSAEHIAKFYKCFDDISTKHYDGLIITGAPLEMVKYEDVDYWAELSRVIDWSKTSVNSTFYVCWAAFAGLYYNYGIDKHIIDKKISGVFRHKVLERQCSLLRGFDDEFYVPHSRFIVLDKNEILSDSRLTILSEGEKAGVYLVMGENGKEFYATGHSEYSPLTLDTEYKRDTMRGLNPAIPENYYKNDNPDGEVIVRWRAHANLLFTNWIHHYVNQGKF